MAVRSGENRDDAESRRPTRRDSSHQMGERAINYSLRPADAIKLRVEMRISFEEYPASRTSPPLRGFAVPDSVASIGALACATILASACALLLSPVAFANDNWPEFRGPTQQGHSDSLNLP